MNLKERRAVKSFQDDHYPSQKKRIDDAAGFEVEVEVDWGTLVKEDSLHLIEECWPQVYFDSLVGALEAIATDDMGKDALKEGLQRVVLKNTTDCANADRCASFEQGVLTIDHRPFANTHHVNQRAKAIQDAIECSL
jgi:hypothetical protein